MSLTTAAPASRAASATAALRVSMEMGTGMLFARASIRGRVRAISTSMETSSAPGRVDSPPTSSIPAPDAISASASATAASRSRSAPLLTKRPPSEKESGVRFSTPTIVTRSCGKTVDWVMR